MKFTTTNAAAASNGIKVLVYGDSGIGKTVLTATLPSPVLISSEAGMLSLRKQNLERIFGVGNPQISYDIPVIEVTNIDQLTQAYEWCRSSVEANQFHSIAIDSISEIAQVVLNNAKRQVKDPRQAYGELMEKMETTVRCFRDLPGKNVYFASQMEPMKDEFTGTVKYGPKMPGSKLGNALPYFMDEVFRIGVNKDAQGNPYRFLQTQPDIQYIAKDRSGSLAPVEEANLTKVFMKILGV